MPQIDKDGFYIVSGSANRDFISVKLDKLTCKEALQCMNKLELSFDGEGPEQVKTYKDNKNRTVDELQNSIRNQCVTTPPASTADANEVNDFMGMDSADANGIDDFMGMTTVVLIGVGAIMVAAALYQYKSRLH